MDATWYKIDEVPLSNTQHYLNVFWRAKAPSTGRNAGTPLRGHAMFWCTVKSFFRIEGLVIDGIQRGAPIARA